MNEGPETPRRTIEEIRDTIPNEEILYVDSKGEAYRDEKILAYQNLLAEYDEMLKNTSQIVKTVATLADSLGSLEIETKDGRKKSPEIVEFIKKLTPDQLQFIKDRRPNDKILTFFSTAHPA